MAELAMVDSRTFNFRKVVPMLRHQLCVTAFPVVLSCFVIGYGFAVVPDAPAPGDPNCTYENCKQIIYYWVNGDGATTQVKYKDVDGVWTRIDHAPGIIWVRQPFPNNGAENTNVDVIRFNPSLVKRICNGAQANDIEELGAKDGNTDTETMISTKWRKCKPKEEE